LGAGGKMIKGLESILIGAANAEKLAEFYRDVVGLSQNDEFEMGENNEKGFLFDAGTTSIAIIDHSEVSGTNKNPERIILNFEVSDIEKETKRLDKLNVKKKQDIYHLEGYGLIATFIDPEGNFFQLVQIKASN